MFKKIGVIHPLLKSGGGSEAVTSWIAEALKKDYKISLLSMGKINLEALNQYYGTQLKYNEINIVEIQIPKLLEKRFDALRSYRLSKYCKENSDKFDLMISTYNVMDFGKKGIQFIADFSFDDDLRRKYDSDSEKALKIFYKKSFLRKFYINFGRWISGESKKDWMKNMTIANSKWSADVLRRNYGISAEVIYPPVEEEFPDIPWKEKRSGFVAVGRLVPEKKFDQIMNIIKRVRERGHDIHLHIIGEGSITSYKKKLHSIARANSSWCLLEGPKYGKDKKRFLSEHKYGISACKNEAFGIAVAELVKAGCIAWVPDGGGQREVVNHEALVYKNIDDAIEKISDVLKNEKEQFVLRKHLKNNSKKFSTEIFKKKTREIVSDFFLKKTID